MHANNFKTIHHLVILLFIFFIINSCAPVFSDLQDARTAGKNKLELTPSYSYVYFDESDKDLQRAQQQIGIQAAYGVSDRVDVRFRYERVWISINNGIDVTNVISIGPKIGIINNKLAFHLPIGIAIGGNTWQTQPTLLITYPLIREKLEFTMAPKYILTFCNRCDDYLALNLGLSLSKDLNKWAIRPEYGILFDPNQDGFFGQLSIGFTTSLGMNR